MTTHAIITTTAAMAAREDKRHATKMDEITDRMRALHFATWADYKTGRLAWIAQYLQTAELPSDSNAGVLAWGRYGGTALKPGKADETVGAEPTAETETETPIDVSADALLAAFAASNWKLCRAIVRAVESAAKVASAK